MNDRPTAAELLEALERFLRDDAPPALDGDLRVRSLAAAEDVAAAAQRPEQERERLEGVARFLSDDCVPALSGHLKYHARVAANVAKIVGREVESAERQIAGEWRRLAALFDHSAEPLGSRVELVREIQSWNEELTLRIRAGESDTGPWRGALIAHLERTVADKLEVARGDGG
jgi:hypothetical protein